MQFWAGRPLPSPSPIEGRGADLPFPDGEGAGGRWIGRAHMMASHGMIVVVWWRCRGVLWTQGGNDGGNRSAGGDGVRGESRAALRRGAAPRYLRLDAGRADQRTERGAAR